ncbi:MAG: class I SAM-dependent methyltransferase [Ignavibacteriales bacterium]|nr:class I SAM-dependent methyltransferase [Ignavibacteriales bacterium]
MKLPQFLAKQFLSKQLAHPSGFLGKYVMGRLLNRTTSSHNTMVLNQMTVQRTDRVLEIGFGGGALLEKIVQKASDGFVAGLELSEEMVTNSRERFRDLIKTGRLEIKQGTVESLPFPDANFNKACTVNTIYFWSDLDRCFAELFRVIKSGGELVIGYTAGKDVSGAGLDKCGFIPYSTDELKVALIAQGFKPGLLKSGSDKRGNYLVLTAQHLG